MRRTNMLPVVILAAVSILGGCGDDPVRPATRLEGNWGAEHIDLVAAAEGAVVEYDCAHGTIDGSPTVDPDGSFDLPGTLVPEGGPVDGDAPPEVISVRYAGRLEGDRLELTVTRADSGDVIGSFVLARGVRGRIRKCL